MEQINTNYIPQVSVIPDNAERKEIRKRYNKAALVLIINILIFNVIGIGGAFIITYIFGRQIWDNQLFSTLFSCCTPILSECIAIIAGVNMFKLNFKPMINRSNYTGGTIMKLITLCLGLQTAASLLASIIAVILEQFGLEGSTAELDPTTSLPANLFMYFYACLLGPVLEELLYRGVLLQTMRKYNERFAIFLSALIFGLMHQNYQQFILGFIVGIPLAVVTIKCGSLLPAIFTHIIMNTTATIGSCWLQYAAPEYYEAALSGNTDISLSILTPDGWAALICLMIFRYGFMLAALVVGIICLVNKRKHMSRPTPAGKARTLPVFKTSACWWVVFALYAFLTFVYPFMFE